MIVLILFLLLFPINIYAACVNNTGSETAASCSQTDVQTAVTACLNGGGGTVYIPAGLCVWSSDVNAQATGGKTLRIIGAGQSYTRITRFRLDVGSSPYMSDIIELAHMTLNGNNYTVASTVTTRLRPTTFGKELYYHHLTLSGYDSANTGNFSLEGWYGVISNVNVTCGGTSGTGGAPYGILVHGDGEYNVDVKRLGTRNALFVEDSTFTSCGHPIVGMCNSHIVYRHNVINQQEHAIDVHEPGYNRCRWAKGGTGEDQGDSGGAFELYSNTIQNPNLGYQSDVAFKPRGGWGVVTDNTCTGFSSQNYCLGLKLGDNSDDGGGCTTGTTCNRCYTYDGGSNPCYGCIQSPERFYFWKNSCSGCKVAADVAEIYEDFGGNGCIRENTDYFKRAPNVGADGFSWTPYQYPHPLVSGGGPPPNQRPEKPKNPRVINP